MEQDEEFSAFMSDLLNLHHSHELKANDIDKCFQALQKIKRKKDPVAPHPGVGFDCITLINHAQNQVFKGVGGRKDLVHELKARWSKQQAELIKANATQDQIWEQFKAHHKKEIHLLDQQGLITRKASESAQSVIPPQQEHVNQETAHKITGLAN